MTGTIKVTLGGKSYALGPLSIHQVSAIRRRTILGQYHDLDVDILEIVWPDGEPLNGLQGVTHPEIVAAADKILLAAGLQHTPDTQARRARENAA